REVTHSQAKAIASFLKQSPKEKLPSISKNVWWRAVWPTCSRSLCLPPARTHFWQVVARTYSRRSRPWNTRLNCTIPALVNNRVGSSAGTSEALGTSRWFRGGTRKYSRNLARMSADFMGGKYKPVRDLRTAASPPQPPDQLPHLPATEPPPREEREQAPPPRLRGQPRELARAALGHGARDALAVEPFGGERLLDDPLGEAALDPLGEQVSHETRRPAAARGVGGGVMEGELAVVEQPPRSQALERPLHRGRRVLLAQQPSLQIHARVPAQPLHAQRRAPGGLEVGQLAQPFQDPLGELPANAERQQIQIGGGEGSESPPIHLEQPIAGLAGVGGETGENGQVTPPGREPPRRAPRGR